MDGNLGNFIKDWHKLNCKTITVWVFNFGEVMMFLSRSVEEGHNRKN